MQVRITQRQAMILLKSHMVRYNMCTPATDVRLDNPEVDMTAYVFEPKLHVQIEEFSPSSFSSVDRVHTSRDLLLEIYIIPHARYMHRQIDVYS